MNKRYYAIALLLCLILIVSACKKSGAATGTAPRKPFIGGTQGITINFEKDSPPPEVTDEVTFGFKTILRLKNDGETKVKKNDISINIVGFDPLDFSVAETDELRNRHPEEDLEPRKQDAEGNIIEGTTVFVNFPKRDEDEFKPKKISGNTEFTFRADVCYNYATKANSKLCILRDIINVRDDSLCKPTSTRQVFSSSAPVQVTNFRQSVAGKNKITFTFDVTLSGNVDLFWHKDKKLPTDFDTGCPRKASERRQVENKVGVIILQESGGPIESITCGGLESGGSPSGVITLISGKRTVTCTANLKDDRQDLEKVIDMLLEYNVLDNKETKVLVKHLAETS